MFTSLQRRHLTPTSVLSFKNTLQSFIRLGLTVLAGLALCVAFTATRVAPAQGSSTTLRWTAAAPYPTTISRPGFAQVGEDFYIIAGFQGDNPGSVNAVRRYNVTTNVWTTLADIPIKSNSLPAAYFGGKIYTVTGSGLSDLSSTRVLQIYDIATNSWSFGASRPGVLSGFGAAAGAFNGNFYVVGGASTDSSENNGQDASLSIYNIATNTWSTGPPPPSRFFLGGYTQVGQFLYLIGGVPATGFALSTVSMRLDMTTNTWSVGPVWTPARADFGLAAAGTKLYALGGATANGFNNPSAQVDELDTSTWPAGAWTASPDSLPSARQGNSAGFYSTGRVGGEIWTTGGHHSSGSILSEHIFRPVSLPLIISEYRSRGPGGARDEFVELYNNTDAPITLGDGEAVGASNQPSTVGGGLTVAASDGAPRCTVPPATVIPARGHFLCAGPDYTLSSLAAGDASITSDIGDAQGLALFNTTDPADFTLANRLDAVGYSTAPALYREGAGFNAASPGAEVGGNLDYSFLRDPRAGKPKDTNDNNADFLGIDTSGAGTTVGANLGAPGPESLRSPIRRLNIFVDRLDQAVTQNSAPNRVRKLCGVAEECDPARSSQGTLSLRRTVTNLTGAPVTRLRFRITDISTLTSPPVAGQADVRALSSGDIVVTKTSGQAVPVRGTVLEQPPNQNVLGGGWNSTWASTGTITLASPMPAGAAFNVQFLLGVQSGGSFRIFITVEALP